MRHLPPVLIIIIYIFCLILHYDLVSAQDSTFTEYSSKFDELGLIFIPADWANTEIESIEGEVADLFTEVAVDLGRFYVAHWLIVDDIMYAEDIEVEDQIDESLALEFGELSEVEQVFLFEVVNFSQIGVPEEEDEEEEYSFFEKITIGLIKAIFSGDSENDEYGPYSDNIRTEIGIEFKQIDVTQSELLQTFSIFVEHTGGKIEKSKSKAFKELRGRFTDELKKLYLLNAQVVSMNGSKLFINMGSSMGIKKDQIFEIFESDKFEKEDNEEVIIPGTSTGYFKVSSVSERSNFSQVLRQWAPIDTGFQAVEFASDIRGFVITGSAPIASNYTALGFQGNWSPIHALDWGGGFRVLRMKDSFEDSNWGIGFGAYGSWRFLNLYKFALKARADLDLDIFFREDDADDTVSLALPSTSIGLNAEILLSPKSDFIFYTGYRFFGSSNSWQRSSDEETDEDAFWIDKRPKMDVSGLFVKIGYRILIF